MIHSVRCGMIIRKPFSTCFPPTPWLKSAESERDTLRVDEYKFQASCECSLHGTMQVLLSNGCCCACLTCRNRPVGGSAALETCTKETFLLLLFFTEKNYCKKIFSLATICLIPPDVIKATFLGQLKVYIFCKRSFHMDVISPAC